MSTRPVMTRQAIGAASFQSLVGIIAVAVGVGGLAYSIAFVIYLHSGSTTAAKLTAVLLMGGGVLGIPVFVAVYERLRPAEPALALLALIFGVVASVGSAIHGGYDLANFINPPAASTTGLPNAVDPRGLMTFAFAGVALLIVAWVIIRTAARPRGLGWLGFAGTVLLAIVYFGRLIILNPKRPGVLIAAVLSGFLVNPAWFVWLGLSLRRRAGAGER